MQHITTAPTRYAFNALWILDHWLGPERSDQVLPGARASTHERMGRELERVGPGGISEIERRDDLDPTSFQRLYLDTDTPVVLAGAARDWKATKTWDFEYFIQRHGELPVQLMNAALGDEGKERAGEERPLGAVLRDALAGTAHQPRAAR